MGKGKRPATYEDIEALPPGRVGEIIDDELYAAPRPASWHTWVASVLGGKLGQAFSHGLGGPGGWWLLREPELLDLHFQEGVSHAWLADPRAHTLEVYRRGRTGWRLAARHGGADIVRAEPFDAEPLDLGSLWAPKAPAAPGP